MSGAPITARIGTQKEMPELGRALSISPLQADTASLAINLGAGSQNENEAFRQGWKAIVGALHSFDKGSGEMASTRDSSSKANVANSVEKAAAVVEGTPRASRDKVAAATGAPGSDSDSTANSTVPRPRNISATLPAQGAITTDSNQRMASGHAEQVAFHSSKVTRKNGQSAKEPESQIQATTVNAPDSLLLICEPAALQAEISQATDSTSRLSFHASESANRKGRSPDNPAGDVVGSAAGVVPLSVIDGRQASTAAVEAESEGDTTPGHSSSHLSPVRTNQEPDRASALVSMQKQTAGVEQAKHPVPDDPSIRPTAIYPPGPLIASENLIKPDAATQADLDRRSRSMQPPTGPLNKRETRHDHAGIYAVQSPPPVKSAIHPFIQSQPVADAHNAAFEQTRSGLVPPASAASMASSPNPGIPSVTERKTAAVHETFAAMDAGMNDGATKWLRADSHRAEAGFQDASLGWVSVRAQAGAAGIHASIMPSSDAAAEVLSGHLAGLNAHIANHYEHLNAVTLSTPDNGGRGHDTGKELAQGSGNAPDHDSRQQTQEHSSPVQSGPARKFRHVQLVEGTNSELQVFTSGMNSPDRHISVVV